MKLKYKKLSPQMRYTQYKGACYIIGKDYGTFGTAYYYFIEVKGKVISHGSTSLKSAKNKLVDILKEVV